MPDLIKRNSGTNELVAIEHQGDLSTVVVPENSIR
jgi:hypothetical protein